MTRATVCSRVSPWRCITRYLVNVGGGDNYLWGTYHPKNESFTPYVPSNDSLPMRSSRCPGTRSAPGCPKMTELERGGGGWFGVQNANGKCHSVTCAPLHFLAAPGPLTKRTSMCSFPDLAHLTTRVALRARMGRACMCGEAKEPELTRDACNVTLCA